MLTALVFSMQLQKKKRINEKKYKYNPCSKQ